MNPYGSELRIKTPEGITFAFALAGPVSRFLAWCIDLAAVGAAVTLLASVLKIANAISLDVSRALLVISYFVLPIAYGIGAEWFWRGQTLGKRVLGLRVLDAHGLKLRFPQIVIRNLLRAVDALPACYLVGGVACFLSRRAQRLGDFAANTIVVRHAALPAPDLAQLTPVKWNSLREHPHLEARLRNGVTPAEARLALGALLRREEFEPGARVALFAALAAHFKKRVVFPPDAVENITDEQYVRNVVDVIFRVRKPDLGAHGTGQHPKEKNIAMPA